MIETDRIYFSKTKEYFREVMSSYGSQNYRSAVVMLYSVVVCDLLLKLEELRDTYNDKTAERILKDVQKCKEDKQRSKSQWEWELIKSLKEDTNFFDLEAFMNLQHLYDYRNMCAHPAVNDSFELYYPNQETVIALIKNILDTILIKPPIFIKGVVDTLSDDLASKREIYEYDVEHLKIYLDNKYFVRMNDMMKLKTAKALWRFVFVREGQIFDENRLINRRALSILVEEIQDLFIKDIAEDPQKFQVSDSEINKKHLIVFISKFPDIYKKMDSEIVHQLDLMIDQNADAKAISWFRYDNAEAFYHSLSEVYTLSEDAIRYIYKHAKNNGDQGLFLDFLVRYFSASRSFDMADKRWMTAVSPFLSKFTANQLTDLVKTIDDNSQIHNRGRAYSANAFLAKEIYMRVDNCFDFTGYTNFKFSEDAVEIMLKSQDEKQGLEF